jgi:hypothetical protein
MTIPVTYEQVTYNSPDGAQVGKSATEKVGFFGATPVVQQAGVTTVTTGETVMAAAINSIIARLEALGLIADISA